LGNFERMADSKNCVSIMDNIKKQRIHISSQTIGENR
jgi:hypothetical protein